MEFPMPSLVALADVRDAFIIIYGAIGIIFFFVAIIVTLFMFFSLKAVLRSLREVLDDSVKPTLGSVKATADSIRGTTEFVAETAVTPVVRTYGMVSGLRRGLGVLTGLSNRGKGK
jgi:hypothetical protein